MEVNREQIRTIVPEGFPPETLLPPNTRILSNNLEDELLRRSFLWASAILSAGLQSNIPVGPRFSQFSAGFVAIDANQLGDLNLSPISRFMFGGCVLVQGIEAVPPLIPLILGNPTVH